MYVYHLCENFHFYSLLIPKHMLGIPTHSEGGLSSFSIAEVTVIISGSEDSKGEEKVNIHQEKR